MTGNRRSWDSGGQPLGARDKRAQALAAGLDGAWPACIKNGGHSDDARKTLIHDHRRRGGLRIGRRFGLGGGDADPLSRSQHQGARPALSAICAGQRGDRAHRRRLPLYRGAGVVRRWPLPPVERHPERPDHEMGGGNRRGQRVSPALALRQRQHPRPPGPPASPARWMRNG